MTTIRTTCPNRYEDVELEDYEVTVEKASKDAKEGQYRFECPLCGETHRRNASERVMAVLEATGVEVEIVAKVGPITEDEITEFVKELDDPDLLNEEPKNGDE